FYTRFEDLAADYPQVKTSVIASQQMETVIALPLCVESRVLGGLAISFAQRHQLDELERGFYLGLANMFAHALDRARITAEQREQHTVVETLLAASTMLSSELDLDRLLQKLTDLATALCRAQFGAFFYN